MTHSTLDESVFCASKELHGRGAPDPEVLFLMATGLGLLPTAFGATWQMPLEKIAGVPRGWRGQTLFAAERREGTFWFLEDAPGDEPFPNCGRTTHSAAPWERAFPVWLAACAGATVCVHTSAGSSLGEGPGARLGLAADHINFSGHSPLQGLGESRLGPLFPDQSRLHHGGLRRALTGQAERLGIPTQEGLVACTSGPTIETPAERAYYARAGADFSVQGLADPLIAMSHAGLACLGVVALFEETETDKVVGVVEGADQIAPALEELLAALAGDLSRTALEMREEV